MKKNIIYILLFVLGSSFLASCEGFLNKEPISSLSSNKFWKSESDIESGTAAMYYSLSQAMRSHFFSWGELRGGNWSPHLHHGVSQEELINHNISETNDACKWTHLYRAINRANLVLKYVTDMKNTSPTTANKAIGEAYAIRALCYFYIIRVWGDAPLFLEAVESFDTETSYKERTDKNIILEQINADIEEAIRILPATGSSTGSIERRRINHASALAIQMDVLAWEHKYDKVVKLWEEQISKLPTSLWAFTDFKSDEVNDDNILKWRSIVFDGTTEKEIFFSVSYSNTENGVNDTRNYFCADGQRVVFSEDLRQAFNQENDIRFRGTAKEYRDNNGELQLTAPYKVEKFWTLDNADQKNYLSENDLIMYRYSDLMLLYAEALNQQNRGSEAIALINKTRTRAGLSELSAANLPNKDAIADAVLAERRLELICEGKYWFDVIRTGNAQRLANCSEKRIVIPIHRDHLLQNTKLVQNQY